MIVGELEQVKGFQDGELMVWDSLRHVDGIRFSGRYPSELNADCPLLEDGYPNYVWNSVGLLCSAYKTKKNCLCIQ